MKFQVSAAALLLPLLLGGCVHKQNQAQNQPLAPPIEDAPPPKPNEAPVNLPPPVVSVPQAPTPPPATTAEQQPPPPKPAPKHRKNAAKPAQTPVQQATPQVATNASPEVSAIGQLSPGEPADLKKETADSIAETEHGLDHINRQLNDQEQKTSAQIREFLKQAKIALNSGDIDGAHTLAVKAKVLLSELLG